MFSFLNPSPQFPIPLIPRQAPVPGRAEGVIRRAFGVALPVAPGLRISNARGAGTDGFGHGLPAVAVGAHPQGDHGVHAGIVLNGQMPADILQIGIIGRYLIYRLGGLPLSPHLGFGCSHEHDSRRHGLSVETMEALTGSANRVESVLRCLLFML